MSYELRAARKIFSWQLVARGSQLRIIATRLFAIDLRLVLVGGEQVVQLTFVGQLHFEQPAAFIGNVVDQLRLVFQRLVDFIDLSGHLD